jgi:ABC-2 type transport system ATP-binding protein
MLSIRNYKKSYSNQLLLDIPKMDFDHGIYWIKGDNGSGKSTFFKSICGIIPFEGDCIVDGLSVKNNNVSYRKLVNYSEAEPLFPAFLTQKDLVKFAANTQKADQKQIDDLTARLGTSDYYHQAVGTYSSGMLKKTGLVMAFLGNPKLIVLDEPFITIDRQSINELVKLIEEYYKAGTTFLISSHVSEGGEQLSVEDTFQIVDQKLERL